jgi:hypothetical protein
MATAAPNPSAWGACRFCGVAVAAGAQRCGICGADRPVAAGGLTDAPRNVRRRVRWTAALRTIVVIGVAVGLTYTIVGAVLSGPPNVADPLTTSGVYAISAGQYMVLSGDITGGDYVVGNYTTIDPGGLSLSVEVYNSSGWSEFELGQPTVPAWSAPAQPAARIIFSAPYTDTYYFVFTNPYPATSGLGVTAYVATEYESNVGDEGFG